MSGANLLGITVSERPVYVDMEAPFFNALVRGEPPKFRYAKFGFKELETSLKSS